MHDYMICIDESGSPYLAHALFGNRKGGQKKDHKWYARENVKGSWRYWYDPESYRRWAQGSIKKAKNAVDNVKKDIKKTSDAYKDYKAALKDSNQAYKEYKKKHPDSEGISYFYGIDKYGRAKKAEDKAKEKLKKSSGIGEAIVETNEKIGKGVSNILDTLSDPNIAKTIKETIKPFDRKKKNVLNKIHEKFKDVTLDVIGPIVDPNGNKARESLKYFNKEADPLNKAVYDLFLGRALNESTYNNSKLGSIERFLDSPIAELHNKKYQQYAWQAGTTDITKPKEILNTAKKAWGERVKRDQARAKSMQRRGVSPQRMLR